MNAEMRNTIRREIDAHRRAQLFTTNAAGKTILKREYQQHAAIPRVEGKVQGISHSNWGYKQHGCRCPICTQAAMRAQTRHKERKRERRQAA